ncbi:MAG: IS701 family transposase [Gammaproteobacteria bacterium]|nr:IS701 family transposase [Gammaproteobacteria bacterium]NIR99145.1 IS701 family transposase [Gammaproteobacteria bacterium]NIT64785.1 IS701 family transposase [Gammaproteobacteria bacterium]NIV21758.1 IS701 family transposase [Gammaproteobacteria bacterium]NIY33365.1 IS701 family transposase [Gammaproteobacteria bacterium]
MAIIKAGAEPLAELAAFLEPFAALLRRPESRRALERYTTGLLSDVSRKTAAGLGRALPGSDGQGLQEFLTRTGWQAAEMDRLRIGHMLEQASVGDGVLVIDDTGLPKKGKHSVGVARQYSGTLGRVDNCQVVVTAHYVDAVFDWPVAARLYLPESWASDSLRRKRAQVPAPLAFQTKGEIALALIDEAREAGVRPRAVVHDAGYGHQSPYLDGLEAREIPYAGRIEKGVHFRLAEAVAADPGDPPAQRSGKRGRPSKRTGLERRVPTLAAEAIVDGLPEQAWQRVCWRDGAKGALVKRCARVRVCRAARKGAHMASAGWLIGERPLAGHSGEPKYYFAWGLDELSLEELVELVHVRWVIERFYQDAKGELGLDDYEGRLWPGLHRHMALVMLAHSFLTLRQSYGAAVLETGSGTPARGFPPQRTEKPRRAPARSA